MTLRGFPPIAGGNPTVLILGSMPGAASLRARQYYAHPRNAFWTIVEALIGIGRAAPYADRVDALTRAGIAVWDVLKTCRREGSLDSAIEGDGLVANDLAGFLHQNPAIARICFNGGTARTLFERHVQPGLSVTQQAIARITLPSTSPTHARLSQEEKVRAWSVIRPRLESGG